MKLNRTVRPDNIVFGSMYSISKGENRCALKRMKLNRAMILDNISTKLLRIIGNPTFNDEFGTVAFDLSMMILNRIHEKAVSDR